MSAQKTPPALGDVRKVLRSGGCMCLSAVAESFYDAVASEGTCPCGRLANELVSSVASWSRKGSTDWKKLKPKLGLDRRRRRRRLLRSRALLLLLEEGGGVSSNPASSLSSSPSSSSSSSSSSSPSSPPPSSLSSSRRLQQYVKLPPAPSKPQDLVPKPLKKIGELIDPGNLLPTDGRPLDELLGVASGKACALCPPITPGDIRDLIPAEGRERLDEAIDFLADTGQAAADGASQGASDLANGVSDLGEQLEEDLGAYYGEYVAPVITGYIEGWVACATSVQGVVQAAGEGKADGFGALSAGQSCASAYAGMGAMSAFVEQVEDCSKDKAAQLDKLYRKHPKAATGDEFGVQEYAELGGSIAASVATENPAALIAWLRDQATKQAIALGTGSGPAACAINQNLAAFTEALFRKFVECVDVSKPCDPELKFAGYTASAGVLKFNCEIDLSKAPVVGESLAKGSGGDGRVDSAPHYLPWVEVRDVKGGRAEDDKCAKSASVLICPAEGQLDREKALVNDAYCGHLPGRAKGSDCMFVAFGDEIRTEARVRQAIAQSAGAVTGDGADKAGEVLDAVKTMVKDLVKDVRASAKSLPRAVKAKSATFGKDFAAAVDAQAAALLEKVASNIAAGKRPTEALEVAEFKGMRVVAGAVSVQCSLLGQVFPGRVVPYVALDTRRGF